MKIGKNVQALLKETQMESLDTVGVMVAKINGEENDWYVITDNKAISMKDYVDLCNMVRNDLVEQIEEENRMTGDRSAVDYFFMSEEKRIQEDPHYSIVIERIGEHGNVNDRIAKLVAITDDKFNAKEALNVVSLVSQIALKKGASIKDVFFAAKVADKRVMEEKRKEKNQEDLRKRLS